MKIREIFEGVVRRGMELDPRGIDDVRGELERKKKDYEKLGEDDRKWFDKEALTNPYADTRLLYGDLEKEVRKALVGVDIEVGEIILADRLRERGVPIDLIISHHPEGRAMANLYEVMDMQSDILFKYGGVPINVAQDIMEKRIKEVERRLMPVNHTRAVDAARLLDIPVMCVHTPADNAITVYLQRLFDGKKPACVSDIIDLLKGIPEYESAMREGTGPKVICGSEKRRAGRIFVDMTGGAGGSKEAFEKLSQAGVGTVVGMHISEDHRKEAEKNHINVVIAGHMSSDSLGINLLLDDVLRDVGIVAASGFRRIART